jgi:hypothetical protein
MQDFKNGIYILQTFFIAHTPEIFLQYRTGGVSQ